METIDDLYRDYLEALGSTPPGTRAWSLDEIRDEWHRRGYTNYKYEGEYFIEAIFRDDWAYGPDD